MQIEKAPGDLGEVADGTGENPTQLVEDPNKALAMAEAGDLLRTDAENAQKQANYADIEANATKVGESWVKPPISQHLEEESEQLDAEASQIEEDTAREYELSNPESIDDNQRTQLAQEAAAEYEDRQKEMSESAFRKAVGLIEAIRKGLIKDATGLSVYDTSPANASGKREKLGKDHQEKLRAAVYAEAGIPAPADNEFQPGGSVEQDNDILPGKSLSFETFERDAPGGVTIIEQRFFRKRMGIKTSVADQISVGNSSAMRALSDPETESMLNPE